MTTRSQKIVECTDLPAEPDENVAYRMLPKHVDDSYYRERTDRNIGWITQEEQAALSRATVGIAGCGGMGGLLANIFIRLGIGEVRIADCERFDISNINRQYAASRQSVGTSKAFETARLVRMVSDDATLVVYPQGIVEQTVDTFLEGCDVICDEIEFWAVGSRILLHERARQHGISLFNCNTVGFGTRLFLFTPDGETMETCLGLSAQEATTLQSRIQNREASPDEVRAVMEAMLRGLVPELPEYCPEDANYRTVDAARGRLFAENKATIIATNPPLASGFLADHVLLHLLGRSSVRRTIPRIPPPPGYLYFDAAFMRAAIVERKTVS